MEYPVRRNESAPFYSSALDSMGLGLVDIGAPLENNIIQIDIDEWSDSTRLLIRKVDSDLIEIERNDDQPLQAEIVVKLTEEPGTVVVAREKVLARPVEKLFFMSESTDAGKVWIATGDGLYVPHILRLQRLANIIGQRSKNEQTRKILEAKKLVK
jgi:hypothetical protein